MRLVYAIIELLIRPMSRAVEAAQAKPDAPADFCCPSVTLKSRIKPVKMY